MKLTKKDFDIPVIALLAANTIPLFGVLFLGWDAFLIVLLYWSENLIIGFYYILKIAFAAMSHPIYHLGKLFFIPLFTIHYGGFTAFHGLFVLALFNKVDESFFGGESWPFYLVFLQLFINVAKEMHSIIPSQMKIAILALFISHGVSFVYNYLLKREFASANSGRLMGSPYVRVVVMHFVIIAGGFFTMVLGSPAGLLLILVVLKTFVDVNLHLRGHKKSQTKIWPEMV